jgi:putative phage-type endonuclease
MVELTQLNSREEWLKARKGIGGSDAASIVGMNPWRDNVELWEIKTGRREQEDISEKPAVIYGTEAEEHLRELFRLDYPHFKVNYVDNNMWKNDKMPWAHASLDGWLTDPDGRKGILEIKTTTIQRSTQKEKWQEQIPQNYYIQLLHYLLVTEFEFAILKAQLKFEIENDLFIQTKHYHIERQEVAEDLEFLETAEKEFAELIKKDKRPDLILPEI